MIRGAARNAAWDTDSASEPVLVVLGCKVRGETPSLMLLERLEAALAYLEDHPDAVCVVSGGMGTGEDVSEAECMFRWLTAHGIGEDRILCEDASPSTVENLLYTQRILEERGLGTRVVLCTNEFHEYRAPRIGSDWKRPRNRPGPCSGFCRHSGCGNGMGSCICRSHQIDKQIL